MSAVVLSFHGGRASRSRLPLRFRMEQQVVRDARLVRDALGGETGWQTAVIMALVKTLDNAQRRELLGSLGNRAIVANEREAEQAAAMIRFETGEPEEIARVATLVARMRGKGQ